MEIEPRVYMPLMEKCALAHEMAALCIDKADGEPPVYVKSHLRTTQAMMYALVIRYFGVTAVKEQYSENERLLGADDCDRYHAILSEHKAAAKEKKQKDAVAMMTSDYEDFCKRLNTEISNTLKVFNDPVRRYIEVVNTQTDLEYVKALVEQLKEAAENVERD